METELDRVLNQIPRANNFKEGLAMGANAVVYIDHTGQLNILMQDVGWLGLEEKKLGHLKADAS